VALFLLSLLAFTCSRAYESQYGIGDIGPSGGTVISVTVESILSDSSVELVGDFEETTYTYTHTETVIEEVETVEYIQQTSYEIVSTETTNNLVTSASKTTSGVVLDHSYTNSTTSGHIHTDYQGGSITWTENLTDYLDVSEINEGFTLYGEADVYACTNQIGGDCSSNLLDTFSITLKVIDNQTGEDYMKTTTWSVGNAWQTYQTSLTVPSNTLGTDTLAIATFYGYDNGYWAGWYGPVIDDMQMWAVYSQVQEVISLVENIVTEQIQSVITSQTYEVDSVYIPPVDVYEPDILADFTIEIDTFEEVIVMDFEIMETDTGELEMQITTFEDNVEVDVEIVELDMEAMVEEMDVEVQSDSEDAPKSTVEAEEKEEQETVQPKDTKETIAAKILERVAEQGDQVALSNVKLAIMAQLTDTQSFDAYQTKFIIDNNVDDYLLQTIEDPYGILFSMAQDQLMNQMVESQYGGN